MQDVRDYSRLITDVQATTQIIRGVFVRQDIHRLIRVE